MFRLTQKHKTYEIIFSTGTNYYSIFGFEIKTKAIFIKINDAFLWKFVASGSVLYKINNKRRPVSENNEIEFASIVGKITILSNAFARVSSELGTRCENLNHVLASLFGTVAQY